MKGLRLTLRQRLIFFAAAVNLLAGLLGALFWVLFLKNDLPAASPPYPLIPLMLAALTAIPLSVLVSKPAAKPFVQMIEATKAVSRGDYHVREEEEGEGEVLDLLCSFNRMTAELESTEMMRSGFINDFSHQFKTPIASILGFAKRLRQETLTPEQRRDYLDFIVSESRRLAGLSSDILLLNRYENQQLPGERNPYDLDEQLRRCILLLEDRWSAKRLELDVDLPPLRYTGSEEMLDHVWQNLLENAVKFSNPGGLIRVHAAQTGGVIRVTVADEGIGMDRRTLEHCFDRFFQGEPARGAGGNGLGLSLARRIVELCGGTLTAESEEGAGSAFLVCLPAGE